MANLLSASLSRPMHDGDLSIVPINPQHFTALREACSRDLEIWNLFPLSFDPLSFDQSLATIRAKEGWIVFVIADKGCVVGMTSYVCATDDITSVDIGASYLEPEHRGTGVNRRVKRLMIDRAEQSGVEHICFRIDTRNLRSRRAVEKLGARLDTVLKRDLRIWTGHWRDTAVYRLDLNASKSAYVD